MKTFVLLIALIASPFLFGQNQSTVDQEYLTDSVHIENIVEFYSYYDFNKGVVDAVKFKIVITNLGSQPIPNILRVSNRTKYLTLLYNGEDSYDLNIGNGTEAGDWPWLLYKNESDSFYTGYVLYPDAGIFQYDQPLNVTWKYMDVSSTTEIVDLKHKKVY